MTTTLVILLFIAVAITLTLADICVKQKNIIRVLHEDIDVLMKRLKELE